MKKELEIEMANKLRDYLINDDITWMFLDTIGLDSHYRIHRVVNDSKSKKELNKNYERIERNIRLLRSALGSAENKLFYTAQSKYESLCVKK